MEHPVHFTAHCLVKYELWVKCETCCSLEHGNNYDEVTHNLETVIASLHFNTSSHLRFSHTLPLSRL